MDRFNPLERTNLELSGGSRPRLVLQYRRTKKRVIVKSYRHNPHEIFSEYLASALAKKAGIPAQNVVLKTLPPTVVSWLKEEAGDALGAEWMPIAVEVTDFLPRGAQIIYGKEILESPERRLPLHHVQDCLRNLYDNHRELIQSYVDMVVFDAFIGNMDRHHENWGICVTEKFRKATLQPSLFNDQDLSNEIYLTPLFDHGSSLLFELSEKKLSQMLTDPDRIVRYNNKPYGFILTKEGKRGNVFDILQSYSQLSPEWDEIVKKSVRRIVDTEFSAYEEVIRRMPTEIRYGWTDNRKNVIVKCLEMRYNYLQQLS
jgi:hypothetical protein